MAKLSVTIITLNEERNIARCLDSLKEVADEIVVVDSYSNDRTKEICLSYGVKFLENKWPGYAEQKNFAHQYVANDLVLSIDADECLSKELSASIFQMKSNPAGNLYMFRRLTNYCGKWIRHCGWYPDKKLRIYNRRECHWEGNVHEQLIYPEGKNIVVLDGDCLHYSFYTINEHRRQADNFTTLAAQKAYEKGERSNFFLISFAPVFKFIQSYIIRLGILDGYYGFIVCRISAHATFMKYVKLQQLWKKTK
jgi:glycosyltransferase involved in cell wall biosynthesis